jgi:hypothetical protein
LFVGLASGLRAGTLDAVDRGCVADAIAPVARAKSLLAFWATSQPPSSSNAIPNAHVIGFLFFIAVRLLTQFDKRPVQNAVAVPVP